MCPNNCLLFRGDVNGALTACTVCNAPRYKRVGDSWVPLKILRHFPVIPRLRRLFSTPAQAALQTWWTQHRSPDGNVRGAFDSKQWIAADSIDPDFTQEHRNIRLGLATDGINPFSIKRSTWSTWPVVLLNYNIPPWLTTKNHFMMLSLIVPGPKSITGAHFDIILAPLLMELLQLWNEGMVTVDAAMYQGIQEFTLRVLLLWTIHDFPAYGLVAGCMTKGFHACPVCGPSTVSRRSAALKKNVYDDQHRKWLPLNHPFRSSLLFKRRVEMDIASTRLMANQVLEYGTLRSQFLVTGSTPKKDDLARNYGINRASSLFSLPYWRVSIRHPMKISIPF
jgi:hypothetical protein